MLLVALVAGVAWWASGREFTEAINAPPGFEGHRGSHYRLACPAGWRARSGLDGQGDHYEEFNGPATPQGVYAGQVRVGHWAGSSQQLEGRLLQYRNSATTSGHRILKEEPVLVKGAVRAHRFEAREELRTLTGASARLRRTDIFALTEDQVLLQLTVRVVERGDQEKSVPRIVGSFEAQGKRRGFRDLLDSLKPALP